ncbi:hypothetical protein AGMMS50293_15880 [Spirochaetia bacterium]|nr:hypothetical protein AGMMS50293_15880 [Spirochaetia bacterium]
MLAASVEFHTDRDDSNTAPYPLKPVFSPETTVYDVYVHEKAEIVYPLATPEQGSTVEFMSGHYVWDGVNIEVPFENGGYDFPIKLADMEISFRVFRDYREDNIYTAKVIRRPDPGRIKNLAISVARFEGTVGNKSDPADNGWIYETDNYMVNYDPSGLEFTVTIPYYAEKVIFTPSVDPDIKIAYALYPQDPQYYPDQFSRIEFYESAIPQFIDFTESQVPGYVSPHLYVKAPLSDSRSGQKTSYLKVFTIQEDAATHEQRYPQNYKLKLVWDKSYAYLNDLDVRDDKYPLERRILGNFFKGNTSYEAEVDAATTNVTLTVLPRDTDSTVSFQQWTALGGSPEGTPVDYLYAPSIAHDVPFTGKTTTFQVTVENHTLFTEADNRGRISYWVVIRRAEPLTQLMNLKIEGIESGTWKTLFEFDSNNDGFGPDSINLAFVILKDPPALPAFALNDVINFTLEIDGAKVSKLRFTGVPSGGGSISYNVGDDPEWPPDQNEAEFNGGMGVSITASEPDHKNRVYALTIIRAGAQLIELYTDMREPPSNGDSILSTSPWPTSLPLPTPPAGYTAAYLINDSERGTFQAIVNGRAVNNALPTLPVTIRVTPRLGWVPDKLHIIDEEGLDITSSAGFTITTLAPNSNPGIYECTFTMPQKDIKLLLTYQFAAGTISNVAYVAPEGKASRYGAYGTNTDGTGTGNTGTSWAYATCNLQGVIDAFGKPGNTFTEIWLLEGTYRLVPPANAPDATKDSWWAEAITDHSDPLSRSFVLKEGLRLYGGFKGKEGDSTPANLKIARDKRFSSGDTVEQQQATARRTILSGDLRDGTYARHVVIAANLSSPDGDPSPGTNRDTLATPANYNFDPFNPAPTSATDPRDYDFRASFNANGVTLLDTLTIRDGLYTKDTSSISVNGKSVDKQYGAGLYNIDASPYLRNVIISDNTSVKGGGMYTVSASYPVLKRVLFENNDVTGYSSQSGDGGGLGVFNGMPAIIDCVFSNNATIGGYGAGLHVNGGKALLQHSKFRYNNAAYGGGISNSGETWVYNSDINNNTASNGAGIWQGGSLYLVDVRISGNNGNGIINGGTLSGTALETSNPISNSGSLALVNSTLNAGANFYATGPATALTNVTFNNSSLFFSVTQEEKTPGGDVLRGCILTNVVFNGGSLSASYNSLQYDFHHGAANLLLNSVRVNGGGISLTQNSYYPDGKKGLYVTMNNVTATNGLTVTNGNKTIAVPIVNPALNSVGYDVLDLRIRNSVILGNTTSPAGERRIIGTIATSGTGSLIKGTNTWNMSPDKAALLNGGDTFRITSTNDRNSAFRPSVNIVTLPKVSLPNGLVSVTFESSMADNYVAGNYIVLTDFDTSLGTVGGSGGTLSAGSNPLTLTPAQAALLPVGAVFRFSNAGVLRPLVNTVTANDPLSGEVTFDADSSGSYAYESTDHIMISSVRTGRGIVPSSGTFLIGDAITLPLPGQADLFSVNDKLKIAQGSPDGTLRPEVYTVTAADILANTITLDEDLIYSPGDYFVLSPSNIYVNLDGNITWLKSLLGGADKGYLEGSNPPSWTGLIPGIKSDGSAIGMSDNVLTATYYPAVSYLQSGAGDSAIYPTTAAAAVTQCFERFKLKWNFSVTHSIEDSMTTLLGKLYTWSGTPGSESLSPAVLGDFLGKDADGNSRKTTWPTGGNISIGAYQQ